jgi:hypothetical protein
MNSLELTEETVNAIQRQLWKYYDVDIEINKIFINEEFHYYQYVQLTVHGITVTEDYKEWNSTQVIKCKVFPHTIEDLYLFDGEKFIEPTTSKEQQENR